MEYRFITLAMDIVKAMPSNSKPDQMPFAMKKGYFHLKTLVFVD